MTMPIAFFRTKMITLEEAKAMYPGRTECTKELQSVVFEVKQLAQDICGVPHVYGCHNRKPLVTVCATDCRYTHTALGQSDKACLGCKERHHA